MTTTEKGNDRTSFGSGLDRKDQEPIAVIGFGCRFPGAPNPEAFWQLLRQGRDAITRFPADRFFPDPLHQTAQGEAGKIGLGWGGFLDQIDRFDAQFFSISPREAARMDPQQRLLLEVAWESLENAGVSADKLARTRTGVFVGISNIDFAQFQFSGKDLAHFIDGYSGSGIAHSIAANRISYLLNVSGPSMAVDTACSSSLVAVHLASQSLRSGESDLALAGGVNITLSPEVTLGFSKARMLSPEGRCKPFDAHADGYVRSEGCGVVVLKRLSDALQHGDCIMGLLRASAVNHDGRTNGLTAPNGKAQQAVIERALTEAGLNSDQVSYIEAQGTGTVLGDLIEFKAVSRALFGRCPTIQPCLIGSVKANIGHLESASGMASLIKVLLCLRYGQIPAQINLTEVSSQIRLENAPLVVSTELCSWSNDNGPRFAGVNGFGFGGTNAHVVIEEAPPRAVLKSVPDRPRHLLTLSAKSLAALRKMADRLSTHVASNPDLGLADICYSANSGRSCFAHRLAVTATSIDELCKQLIAFASTQEGPGLNYQQTRRRKRSQLAFVFGDQILDVGPFRELYETQPTFRRALDQCAVLINSGTDYPSGLALIAEADQQKATVTQSAVFSLEMALAKLWLSWGVKAEAVTGTGTGEYAAACVAGTLSVEAALTLLGQLEPVASPLETVQALRERGFKVFIHIGMESSSLETDAGTGTKANAVWLPSVQMGKSAWEVLLESHGRLFTSGGEIDGAAFDQDYHRRRVGLPTYPFERKRYWLDSYVSESLHSNANPSKNTNSVSIKVDYPSDSGNGNGIGSFHALWRVTPVGEREQILLTLLRSELCRTLSLEPTALDSEMPLDSLGLDSLTLLELKERLESAVGVVLPMDDFLDKPTLRTMASKLCEILKDSASSGGGLPGTAKGAGEKSVICDATEAQQLLRRLDELTDEEVNGLLGYIRP